MRFTSILLPLIAVTATASAQPPHLGIWEIDHARSDGGEVVWEFVDLGADLWEFRIGGIKVFDFEMGDEPDAAYSHARWDAIDERTYLTNLLAPSGLRDVVKVAADGSNLSLIKRRYDANGALEERIDRFERFSGGPGLAGTWRAEVGISLSHPRIELAPGIDEWFVFRWSGWSRPAERPAVCVLMLDDSDYPCFGALLPSDSTVALHLADDSTLKAVFKVRGEVVLETFYSVSANGESMTATQTQITGERSTAVYNRLSASK